jgi:hypothetical protein
MVVDVAAPSLALPLVHRLPGHRSGVSAEIVLRDRTPGVIVPAKRRIVVECRPAIL